MDKFVTAAIITGIYVLGKILESRVIKKEEIVMKKYGKDSIIVYLAAVVGIFVYEEYVGTSVHKPSTPGAYTDSPEF